MKTPPLMMRLLWICSLVCVAALTRAAEGRVRLPFDADWRFAIGHATEPAKDFNHATGYFSYLTKTGYGDGAASRAFDDRGWRQIDLPHDWAIEVPFDPAANASHGYRAVGPGFPQSSVGWYRKTFTIPAEDLGRRVRVTFDGVFRHARVFINGFYVGEEPSGYLPITYDLTDYLRYGEDNVLAVRVDASMQEGWYYEGAGIYRHVWLTKNDPVHLVEDGTWIRSDLVDGRAHVSIDSEVTHQGREAATVGLRQTVLSPEGKTLQVWESAAVTLNPGQTTTVKFSGQLDAPRLWSLEDPALHTLVTEVFRSGEVVDTLRQTFGVRTAVFDPNHGFFLNGKKVVLKGTNNHQDHAGIGVALPDGMQEYRLRQLQAMGSNAYRTSHHPPTKELLEACDRLGILVIDETRLMGINPYHLTQLERLIRRDRNHPSVILWSIGNEEWAIEGNIFGARITTTMQDFARRLDPTRRTTVAISGGWGGSSTTIDVMGVNYIRHGDLDRQHAKFPEQIILGTEETTTQQTRGIYFRDAAKAHLEPLADGSSGGNAESGWRHYAARPYTAGIFYWTGFDYRGETTPFGFPAISSQFGILDTCGFPKDGFYYLQAWWTDKPVLHLFPHWNWAGREGQPIEVKAHTNCDEVELFLNGVSQGRQKVERHYPVVWNVRYAPGRLEARGYRHGQAAETTVVSTTGATAGVRLLTDWQQAPVGRKGVAVFTVEAVDAQGQRLPTGAVNVTLSLQGPGRILGVGNGDPSSHEADKVFASVAQQPIGHWQAPDAAPNPEGLRYEATFDRPESGGAPLQLLLNALGPRQTVVLNGRTLYRDAEPALARTTINLGADDLKPSGNTLVITSERFADWGQRETLRNFHPATLRWDQPAPAWQRTTFNGLAQVIVETTGEPGTVTLTGTPTVGQAVTAVVEVR